METYWVGSEGASGDPAPAMRRPTHLVSPAAHAAGARLPGVRRPGGVRVALRGRVSPSKPVLAREVTDRQTDRQTAVLGLT